MTRYPRLVTRNRISSSKLLAISVAQSTLTQTSDVAHLIQYFNDQINNQLDGEIKSVNIKIDKLRQARGKSNPLAHQESTPIDKSLLPRHNEPPQRHQSPGEYQLHRWGSLQVNPSRVRVKGVERSQSSAGGHLPALQEVCGSPPSEYQLHRWGSLQVNPSRVRVKGVERSQSSAGGHLPALQEVCGSPEPRSPPPIEYQSQKRGSLQANQSNLLHVKGLERSQSATGRQIHSSRKGYSSPEPRSPPPGESPWQKSGSLQADQSNLLHVKGLERSQSAAGRQIHSSRKGYGSPEPRSPPPGESPWQKSGSLQTNQSNLLHVKGLERSQSAAGRRRPAHKGCDIPRSPPRNSFQVPQADPWETAAALRPVLRPPSSMKPRTRLQKFLNWITPSFLRKKRR